MHFFLLFIKKSRDRIKKSNKVMNNEKQPERRRELTRSIPMSKKLLKVIGKTNAEFKLIGEGDKILVGLSGGKDSLALVHAMKHIQRHAPFNFEFEACTIKYGMPDEHYDFLSKHCE
jgi:predicted PP-loop superfamily ATPase